MYNKCLGTYLYQILFSSKYYHNLKLIDDMIQAQSVNLLYRQKNITFFRRMVENSVVASVKVKYLTPMANLEHLGV